MDNYNSKVLKMDDILALPAREMDEWLEVVQFMDAHEHDWLFPEKDVAAYKSVLREKLPKLLANDPEMTLREALDIALEPVPKSLDDAWVGDIVSFTIEKWEALKYAHAELATA